MDSGTHIVFVTPEGPKQEVPANYGQPNCECRHCAQTKARRERGMTLNHGAYKTAAELGEHERNRLALPGDVDYEGLYKPDPVRYNSVVAEGRREPHMARAKTSL